MKKLTRHQIVIGLSYSFCAFNCIVIGLASIIVASAPDISLFGLGLIFMIMAPISVLDPKKEMQGRQAAICAVVLHILFNILISIFCLHLWLAILYIPEAAVLLALEFTHHISKHK